MSNYNGCPFPSGPGCPYQTEDGCNDRNRFPNGHVFVGEIENGKRYPYGVYSKKESDDRYAAKSVESYVAQLAEDVSTKAEESECVDIRARLDALESNSIRINSFTATPAVCELGSTNTILLQWSLSKAPTAQTINEYPVEGTSKQYTSVSTAQTYTLSATDGIDTVEDTVSVTFANNVFYGAAADLTSVTTLTKVLSNNRARTFTANAGAGQYIIYAIPARLGAVEFFVSGFEGGFEPPQRQILTNASGYQEAYNVYRSTNKNLGLTVVEVREA